jgi:hypothetical protein
MSITIRENRYRRCFAEATRKPPRAPNAWSLQFPRFLMFDDTRALGCIPRPAPRAYLRLETLPGEEAQVAWGGDFG